MVIPSFASWLANTVLPLGALWLLFRFLLRQEQCFGYNRVLLVLAPVAAVALPLLPHPEWPRWLPGVAAAEVAYGTVLLPVLPIASGEAAGSWPGWAWLAGLYLAGVALGLGRLAYRAWHLYQTARHLPREQHPGYALAYTGGQLPTSSFGNTVFWDDTTGLTAADAPAVLAHELAHVRQGHTYDILWLEVWRTVLWVNPFAHLLLPALRLTHELLADREAAAEPAADAGAATPYPTLLARLATRSLASRQYSTLLQPFTFSFTLTRIAMLQHQVPVRRWKQWLALPVLAGVFLVAGRSASAQSVPPPPPPPVPSKAEAPAKPNAVYTYVEQMPALPGGGGVNAIVQAIQSKIVYPAATSAGANEGRVFVSFVVQADGTVGDTKVIKGLSNAFDEAVLAAVRQLPRFIPGKQHGRAVAVSFTVPVEFKKS